MAGERTSFPHLRLVAHDTGTAKLSGGGKTAARTRENKNARLVHSTTLGDAVDAVTTAWREQREARSDEKLPAVDAGIPLLLEIDPDLDLDELRAQLGFEIVAERDDRYVIVASNELDLDRFRRAIEAFATAARGSGSVASVYNVVGTGFQLRLSENSAWVIELWPQIRDDQDFIVDVGVECAGIADIPREPTMKPRGDLERDAAWAKREARFQKKKEAWSHARATVYEGWDALKQEREHAVRKFVRAYEGEILGVTDDLGTGASGDSFTVRIRVSGQGLKDLIANYPFIFEVLEPDDIELPQSGGADGTIEADDVVLLAPSPEAPAVGVIDSGIQEAHRWLAPAIDAQSSISLVRNDTSGADLVTPGGHGTRVAGAVLFGEHVPRTGTHQLPFWLQNVRVLDAGNDIPREVPPAQLTRAAILRLRGGSKATRVFNHSINSRGPCRTTHMSAWAAEIDQLSFDHDILVVQSAGNLESGMVRSRLNAATTAGSPYPGYLEEPTSRVANPGHSLQALTVGSVAYARFDNGRWKSFATRRDDPSAFTRCGLGIWGCIKPEVVEYGGDFLHMTSEGTASVASPLVASPPYPDLVRSTLGGGPAIDRDTVGTSFSAPKVTHIAAHLQALLPDEPALLYRALIVQSARWPLWARTLTQQYRAEKELNTRKRAALKRAEKKAAKKGQTVFDGFFVPVDDTRERKLEREVCAVIRTMGFGLPDITRATRNNDHRITLISSGHRRLVPYGCDVLQVPVPASIRAPGNDYDVLVEVTLSFAAQPRRTRRTTKRYLSTWLDWISSKPGETLEQFRVRALKPDAEGTPEDVGTTGKETIPWALGAQDGHGHIRGVSRGTGTVQKDWAVVKLHQLPETFCIAVRGHKGWSRDPEAEARYALAVSFEVIGAEIAIYEEIEVEVERLQTELEERV